MTIRFGSRNFQKQHRVLLPSDTHPALGLWTSLSCFWSCLVMLGSRNFSNFSSPSQSIIFVEGVVDRGLVALAVAITQPRTDSQETRPLATLVNLQQCHHMVVALNTGQFAAMWKGWVVPVLLRTLQGSQDSFRSLVIGDTRDVATSLCRLACSHPLLDIWLGAPW